MLPPELDDANWEDVFATLVIYLAKSILFAIRLKPLFTYINSVNLMLPSFSKESSFRHTGLDSPITEFAMPLAALRDDVWHASGTAILISPHLAITAKHVIEDHWNYYERRKLIADSDGSFSLIAFQYFRGERLGALWNIGKIWTSKFTDIAFLRLTAWSERSVKSEPRAVQMELVPPPVGSRVSAFGYHSSEIRVNSETNDIEVEWKDSPTTSIGEVSEIYREGRDSHFLNFPCYRTTARFDAGMSGGPIFNDAGRLCGLICAGTQGADPPISYGASLWPCMGDSINLDRSGYPAGVSYRVLELAKDGFIKAHNWDRVEAGEDQASGHSWVRLRR